MKTITTPMGDELRPQPQQALPHGAAPLTPSASEVAAPSAGPELDLSGMIELPDGTQAQLALDPVLARQLPLALIVTLLELRELARKDMVEQVDGFAKGMMPAPVLGVVLPLVRGALVGCSALPAGRRDYVAALLPASPVPFGASEAGRIAGLAVTAEGYDLALRMTDGSVRVMRIVLPPHLVADVVAAVLTVGVSIAKASSAADARMVVSELVGGRAQPLADAVALALLAALCADPDAKEETTAALCGLDAVQAVIERVSANVK